MQKADSEAGWQRLASTLASSPLLSAENINPFVLYEILVAPLYPGIVGPSAQVYTYSGEKGLYTIRIPSSLPGWALATRSVRKWYPFTSGP